MVRAITLGLGVALVLVVHGCGGDESSGGSSSGGKSSTGAVGGSSGGSGASGGNGGSGGSGGSTGGSGGGGTSGGAGTGATAGSGGTGAIDSGCAPTPPESDGGLGCNPTSGMAAPLTTCSSASPCTNYLPTYTGPISTR